MNIQTQDSVKLSSMVNTNQNHAVSLSSAMEREITTIFKVEIVLKDVLLLVLS